MTGTSCLLKRPTQEKDLFKLRRMFKLRRFCAWLVLGFCFLTTWMVVSRGTSFADTWDADTTRYVGIIRKTIHKEFRGMYRPAGGSLKYPFLAPGSAQYQDELWDWDSWLSNVALRQALLEAGTAQDRHTAVAYEQGSVLNFLAYGGYDGWIPILLKRKQKPRDQAIPKNPFAENMHKPVLAQHAAFLTKLNGGDAEWLRDGFYPLQAFVNQYRNHHRHKPTGLYYWETDQAIGVDNDPATFGRPPGSSASIYLNCLMYRELLAMVYLAGRLNQAEIGALYQRDADDLRARIQQHMWDERDGFFYSVDINLVPYKKPETSWDLHSGGPRSWDGLIQRLGVWSGFLGLWAEIATPEQAKRIVAEHLKNDKTFNAPYGVRTLSKMEKMYDVRASGNPSSWLGPIWGVSNYLVFRGLVKYGFRDEARALAIKTIRLFGRDLEKQGALHEYYLPESGEPVLNKGFQNWNYLVLNMVAWLDGKETVAEF